VTPSSIQSSDIADNTIVNNDINTLAAIAGTKIDPNFGSQNVSTSGTLASGDTTVTGNIAVSGTVDGRDVAADGLKLDGCDIGAKDDQTAAEIRVLVESATDSNVFTDTDHSRLNAIEDNATADQTVSEIKSLIAGSPLDASHLAPNSVGDSEIVTGALDNRYYTEAESDARYFNVSTGDTIKDGDTFPDNDTTIATTAAINDRIIDLVDDVGGFVPIANETSFPSANPDVNNGTGTLVSIKALSSNLTSNGSGVASISNGAGSGKTVHITGLANSTTYAATFGLILETTQYSGGGRGGSATDYEYTFHRQVPKATEVTTVASNVSNVNTVASNIAAVNTVNSNISTINVVAANNSNVNTVATSIANVNTVATNLTDVSNFADLYQIATSAPSTDGGGNSLAAGDLWFDSSSNKVLKVHDGSAFKNVTPTQSVLDDISIVSGTLTRQEDLGSIADSITSGSSTGALDTCATNITNINSFANVYRIATSAPSSSLDAGDLWYDATANVLKYYNGTVWTVTAAAGLSNMVEDTSPELGGHLDCNDKNLTEVGTVSGNNLQIDFGTI